jgi:hypothetical protein
MSPWFSSGLVSWVAAGRPTVDFVSADRAWNAAGRTFVDASGRPVPVVFGTITVKGSNILWFGEKSLREYEKSEGGGKKS